MTWRSGVSVLTGITLIGATIAAPVFDCPDTVFKFGTVPSGPPITHAFTVTNRGDQPLELQDLRSSCGACMTVKAEKTTLAPGEKTGISASVKTTGLHGPVKKLFLLKTNDPASGGRFVTFIIEGEVKPPYTMQPDWQFDLGQVNRTEKQREWKYRLSLPEEKVFKITAIDVKPPCGFTGQTVLNTAAKVQDITVRSNPGDNDLHQGAVHATVAISTDPPTMPVIEIPLTATVSSSVSVRPDRLLLVGLPATTAGKTPSVPMFRGVLEFRRTPPTPFNVTDVVVPRPEIKTVIMPAAEGCVRIIASAEGVLPEGPAGDLVVHTDDPATPELRIPVHVIIAKPSTEAPAVTKPAPPTPPVVVLPAVTVINAVAAAYNRKPEEFASVPATDEAAGVAVWLVSKLSTRADVADARERLGKISPLRFARARDAVTRRMEKDPAFAERCRGLLKTLTEANSDSAKP